MTVPFDPHEPDTSERLRVAWAMARAPLAETLHDYGRIVSVLTPISEDGTDPACRRWAGLVLDEILSAYNLLAAMEAQPWTVFGDDGDVPE